MSGVRFRPINTSLIDAEVGGHVFRSVDADAIARRVFARIDAVADEATIERIARNFVDGLAVEGCELPDRLSALYQDDDLRVYPAPPIVTVEGTPAASPFKWMLTWSTSSPDGVIGTELSTERYENPTAEATPYELALLACDIELNDETLAQLATTPVNPAPITTPSLPDGPASGSATFNVNEPMGVRATVVRGFYSVSVQSPVLDPFVDRDEEIVVASLDELASLKPDSIAVSYEHGDPRQRVPVLLANGPFDAAALTAAVNDWRTTQKPPDGEMIFDVTAARLRLRRVVIR